MEIVIVYLIFALQLLESGFVVCVRSSSGGLSLDEPHELPSGRSSDDVLLDYPSDTVPGAEEQDNPLDGLIDVEQEDGLMWPVEPIRKDCFSSFFYTKRTIKNMLRSTIKNQRAVLTQEQDRNRREVGTNPCVDPDDIWDYDSCASRCVNNYPYDTIPSNDPTDTNLYYYIARRSYHGEAMDQYIPHATCPTLGSNCEGTITVGTEKRYIIVGAHATTPPRDRIVKLFDVDTYCNCV